MINHGHVHNGHAYATLTRPFFIILKKIPSFPYKTTT